MSDITLESFERFANDHMHGQFYVHRFNTPDATLGRHFVRSMSGQENRQARLALFSAIRESGCLNGLTSELQRVKKELGLDDSTASISTTPLKLRTVRALIERVREAGMGELAPLQEFGFVREDITLLRRSLPKVAHERLLNELKKPPQEQPPELVADLRQQLSRVQVALQIQSSIASGDEDSLVAFVMQKCYSAVPPAHSLDEELIHACLARALSGRKEGLKNLPINSEMVNTLHDFIAGCARDVLTIAAKADELKLVLREETNTACEQVLPDLPEADRSLAREDFTLFSTREFDRMTDHLLAADFEIRDLELFLAAAGARFRRGLATLLAKPHPSASDSAAEITKARARLFAEVVYDQRARPLFESLTLRPADDTHLRETFCRRANEFAARFRVKDDSPLTSQDLCDIEQGMDLELLELGEKLGTVASCRSGSEGFVVNTFAEVFAAEGITDLTAAEKSAARTIYERLYAAEVVPRCADLALQDVTALDEAVENIVRQAVLQVKAARAASIEIEHQLDFEQRVCDFRSRQDVTEDMRTAFNEHVRSVIAWVGTELLRDPSASNTKRVFEDAKTSLEKKIDELVSARERQQRKIFATSCAKIRQDFNEKIGAVEDELLAFTGKLPPLKDRTRLDLRPGVLPLSAPAVLDEIWGKACDDVRARYARTPRDFEPTLPKFEASPFLKACKEEVVEAWRKRGDVFVKAVEDLEAFLRESGLPNEVGLTNAAFEQETPSTDETRRLQVLVAELVAKVGDAALAGEFARVEILLNAFKKSVTQFIAAHNARVFNIHMRQDGHVDNSGMQAILAYGKVALDLVRTKAKVLPVAEGFDGDLFEVGYRELSRLFAHDGTRYHTEDELIRRLNTHYRRVVDLWKQLTDPNWVRARIVERAEPQFYALSSHEAATGDGKMDFDLLLTPAIGRRISGVIADALRRMMAEPSAFDEKAMLADIAGTVDKVIRDAQNPVNEQRREIQDSLLLKAEATLVYDAEVLATQMTSGFHLSRVNLTKEELLAAAKQWTAAHLAPLRNPLPEPDDGMIHPVRYSEPNVNALQKQLRSYLKDLERMAPKSK